MGILAVTLNKKGYVIFFLAATLFGLQAFLVKILSNQFSPSVIIFLRFLFGFSILTIMKYFNIINIKVNANNTPLLISRGVFGSIGTILLFFALPKTTLGNATLLTYTQPIFTTILGFFILKEKITVNIALLLLISLVGIFMVTNSNFNTIRIGDILAIGSGISSSFVMINIRILRKNISSWIIYYYLNLIGLFLSFPLLFLENNFSFFDYKKYISITLIFLLLVSFFAHICMTYAYKFCNASEGSIMIIFAVVVATMLGVLVLNEEITSNFIIGVILISFSSVYLILIKGNSIA